MERTLLEFHQTEEIQAALDLKHNKENGVKEEVSLNQTKKSELREPSSLV
jgi:hypothetical protein